MLSKNKYNTLNDDKTLGFEKLSCLIALHSSYQPLHRVTTFYATPYSPHRFSRQFGFWQELPGVLKLDHPYTQTTTYNDALYFWTALDMTSLNPRRAQGAILQRMDPISRTKIMMLSILANPLILLLPVEERALSK